MVGAYYGAPVNRSISFRLVPAAGAGQALLLGTAYGRGGEVLEQLVSCVVQEGHREDGAPYWCADIGGSVVVSLGRIAVAELNDGISGRWCAR